MTGHITRECPRMREQTRQARAMVQEPDPEQCEVLRQELNNDTSSQNNTNTKPPPECFPSAQQ